MYLLLTDETNTQPGASVNFFVYGRLILPLDAVPEIDTAIASIRQKASYAATDELKFDTRARPQTVTIEAATAAKKQVVELCIATGCTFIVYVIHHAIARNRDPKDIVAWGANCVISRFNKFLHGKDDFGICLIDRLPDISEYGYLTEKFTKGLQFPDEKSVSLDRIKLFGSTCTNASHLSSAMDIVLGSFRYCINQPKNPGAASEMMKNVTKLIWHTRVGDSIYAEDKGLIIRPVEIRVDSYRKDYRDLIDHINELIKDL